MKYFCLIFVEENLNPVRMTSAEVYNLQERMEDLQRVRATKWSENMAELGRERHELGGRITSSLKQIEESSGIFLIKPVYSYVSRYASTLWMCLRACKHKRKFKRIFHWLKYNQKLNLSSEDSSIVLFISLS